MSGALEVCCGPVRVTFVLLSDSTVVIGTCVVGFKFDGLRVVLNRACVVAEGVLCDAAVAVDFGGVRVDGKYLACLIGSRNIWPISLVRSPA